MNLYAKQDSSRQDYVEAPQKTPVEGTPDPIRPFHPPKVSPLDLPEKVRL